MKDIKKVIVGLCFVAAGTVIILTNLGIIGHDIKRIIISWQMMCIAIGLLVLTDRNYRAAAVLMAVGVFFLLPLIPDLGLGAHFVRNFWPLMLVIVGLIIIIARDGNAGTPASCHDCMQHSTTDVYSQDGYIDQTFCFSGSDQIFIGPEFRGGRIRIMCGGTTLDLRKSCLPENSDAELCLKGVFGGATLIVPENWRVEIRNRAVFGGGSDTRPRGAVRDSARMLIVTVQCVCGGVEIR